MKYKIVVSVLVVIVAGLIGNVDVAVCLETESSITVDAELDDDQYLFVHGQRLTNISLNFDKSTEELVVNGVVIRDAGRDFVPLSDLELLQQAVAFPDFVYEKYEKADRFKSELAGGLSRLEAIKSVKLVEFEIRDLVLQWTRAHPDFSGAQEFVENLFLRYESEGVLREVKYTENAIWVWLQSGICTTRYGTPRPIVIKKGSFELSIANKIRDFKDFRFDGPKMLIVNTQGNVAFLAGKAAAQALLQIEASIQSGNYEKGKFSSAFIADFLK